MAANRKTKKMLNTSREIKVISIIIASSMLLALTGCGEDDSSAITESTTQVAEQTTTEATTEVTTEATTATPTPKPTTEATTEAPPAVTVPDTNDLPDNPEGQVAETPTEDAGNNDQQEPVDPVDDGYWHDDTPTVTAADLEAAAMAQYGTFYGYVSGNGGVSAEEGILRNTDTQYGYYICIAFDGGTRSMYYVVKAETSDGVNITVSWYASSTDCDYDYDAYTNGPYSPSSVPLN